MEKKWLESAAVPVELGMEAGGIYRHGMAGVNVNKSDGKGLDCNSNSKEPAYILECWVETKRNTCFGLLKHVQLKIKRNTYIETAPVFSNT